MAKKRVPVPKRFGPEWWAVYAASFVEQFESMKHHQTFDDRAKRISCDAEHAAAVADLAIEGFEAAVDGGCVEGA